MSRIDHRGGRGSSRCFEGPFGLSSRATMSASTSDGSTPPRTARVTVLLRDQLDGSCLVSPVAAPDLAALGREEDAVAELALFLRERYARSRPEVRSRLSLPAEARLVEVLVALPRDEGASRREPEVQVTFACVIVPARAARAKGAPDRDDAWVLVPAIDHDHLATRCSGTLSDRETEETGTDDE